MAPRISRFDMAMDAKFQQVDQYIIFDFIWKEARSQIHLFWDTHGLHFYFQATATLDLTGKELKREACFDTCKEYPGCGGVYIKVWTWNALYSFFLTFPHLKFLCIHHFHVIAQDTTCHLVDKSVTNQTNSLVAEPGTNSYLLKELRYIWMKIWFDWKEKFFPQMVVTHGSALKRSHHRIQNWIPKK